MIKSTLTVGIISYNRPNELYRALKSILPLPDGVQVVISDDASPKIKEIEDVLAPIIKNNNQIRLIKNSINVGYDQNLFNVILKSNSSHVLLLSDDDMLETGAVSNVFDFISNNDLNVGFLRIKHSLPENEILLKKPEIYSRFCEKNIYFNKEQILNDGSLIYKSILFSGLIFKRSRVIDTQNIIENFFNSIYIQVALFCIISNKDGCYCLSGPGVELGSDGENSFGLNTASNEKDKDLVDRTSLAANINFHKRLFFVIRYLNQNIGILVANPFFKEYKLRSVKAFYRTRLISRKEMLKYWKAQSQLDIDGIIPYYLFYILILLLPKYIIKISYNFLEYIFLKYRKNINKII